MDNPNYFYRETAFLEVFLTFDASTTESAEDEPESLDQDVICGVSELMFVSKTCCKVRNKDVVALFMGPKNKESKLNQQSKPLYQIRKVDTENNLQTLLFSMQNTYLPMQK